MSTIMIRGGDLHSAVAARVKAYARQHDMSVSAAAAELLDIAFGHIDARSAGARATNASKTKAERSESARAAINARWQRERGE